MAIATSAAFQLTLLNIRYRYHHHHNLTSSPSLFYTVCNASIPAKPKLKAPAFELKIPFFSSSHENPLGVCGQNQEMELGSASISALGIIRKRKKKKRLEAKMGNLSLFMDARLADFTADLLIHEDAESPSINSLAFSCVPICWLLSAESAFANENVRINAIYEVGELFELGIQLTYLLLLLLLLGVGSFFVIRQVLVRRELDLSAKELQEQVRSGDASATELFELGAVMLRRKFYPAANKYLLQAIEKWDGDEQDLAQVYNALGVSYVLDGKIDKGLQQFQNAVKLQPGYVTAWNNLGDAYEKKKEYKLALKAFEEVLLFDPNNKVARPRRDVLTDKVKLYKGVALKSKKD